MRAKLALGCDLGATNLRVALVSESGAIVAASREALVDRTPSVVAQELARISGHVLGLAQIGWEEVHGVGVGLAGQVLGSTGMVVVGPNLGWRDVRFGHLVERAMGRTPRVVNDLSAAAWGESRVGAARGVQDALVVFLGSGLGAGIIAGGKLYEGASGIAGELGHVKVRPGGRGCGCGEFGCLEAYVGGHNVAARLQELVAAGQAPGILEAADGDPARVGTRALSLAVERGYPMAQDFLAEMAKYLGWAIGNAVTLLNPQKLILGGGMFHGVATLRERVEEEIRAVAGRAHLQGLSVLESALEDDAGLVGAGLLAFT
jgi:glucokinase